jgi:hypothetical protein
MNIFARLFARKQPARSEPDEPLVPVPIPPLRVLLLDLERQKGAPLTKAEVLDVRDKCVCMMMPLSGREKMAESRGYRDIDPENCWDEWLAFRTEMRSESS